MGSHSSDSGTITVGSDAHDVSSWLPDTITTPSTAQFAELSFRWRPPQSWYDDTADPFVAEPRRWRGWFRRVLHRLTLRLAHRGGRPAP